MLLDALPFENGTNFDMPKLTHPVRGGRYYRIECTLSGAGFTGCRKTQKIVIPRRASRRGIPLFLGFNRRGIPRGVYPDTYRDSE